MRRYFIKLEFSKEHGTRLILLGSSKSREPGVCQGNTRRQVSQLGEMKIREVEG